MNKPLLPRKHDKWMVPATIGVVITLVVLILNWGRWTSNIEGGINNNAKQIEINKKHIQILEQCNTNARIFDAKIATQLEGLQEQIRKVDRKQDRILDKLGQ